MHILILLLLSIVHSNINCHDKPIDLTIVGNCDSSGSIPKIAMSIIEILQKDLNLNFIHTQGYSKNNICDKLLEKKPTPGNVALLTDLILRTERDNYKKVPNSKIKIAYSMLESTLIPQSWASVLNNFFDAVVVPDDYYVKVYKDSGVNIPIFVIPVIIDLTHFLKKPIKIKRSLPFVFGCSAVNYPRKNLDLLIKAFSKAFNNNPDVVLKIHTKSSLYIKNLQETLKATKSINILLIEKNLSYPEYTNFISSLDCYVLISKGEGFSISPREALAAKIPCIISNNTAHKTICKTGFVYPVQSNIQTDAYYPVFNQFCGKEFNCKIQDVATALKEVYNHYDIYLEKAKKSRKWVNQYSHKNLKSKYLNLIKPQKVILGLVNEVTNNHLMTNSIELYKKYLSILN